MKRYMVVTGAAGGIGSELTKLLIEDADILGLVDKNEKNLFALSENIQGSTNIDTFLYEADVSNLCEIDFVVKDLSLKFEEPYEFYLYVVHGVAETNEKIGRESILVAKSNMDSNYYGVINTVVSCIPILENSEKSQIVIISSNSSLRATRRSGEYSASKAAVNLWLESLRIQFQSSNTKITCILPSFVTTPMTLNNSHAMPGIISAQRAASLILKMSKRNRSTVVIPFGAALISRFLHIIPTAIWVRLFLLIERVLTQKIPKSD